MTNKGSGFKCLIPVKATTYPEVSVFRFSSTARAFALASLVLAGGCGRTFWEEHKQKYENYKGKVAQPISNLPVEQFNGFWTKASHVYLSKDHFDPNYDSVVEKDTPKSGVFLVVESGKILFHELRTACPKLEKDAWIYNLGEEKDSSGSTPRDNANTFAKLMEKTRPDLFTSYTLKADGELTTGRDLRIADKETDPHIKMKVLSLGPDKMELALEDVRHPAGVHTKIETYQHIAPEELKEILTKLKELQCEPSAKPVPDAPPPPLPKI